MMIVILFMIISTTLFCASENDFSNLLKIPLGRIEGKTVLYNGTPVRAFLGIPYAKPPLGDLRFKKPVPIKPWSTTLQAKTFPPGCVQYSQWPIPWRDTPPGLSEDCLYLNIWTPVDTSNKKSVMFWIHGGGFSKSSSRLDIYHGEALSAEGDVIVVTINYRLGAEGFFYSGTEDAPGNMGMWDMVEALKWVRNNIESFGGDKASITLFGQSSGAIAVGMFCVSPITRGLFKRAILESGSPATLSGKDNDKTLETSQKLAEAVGCAYDGFTLEDNPQDIVQCMRNQEPFSLAVILPDITQGSQRVYYPRYGDDFLPKDARQAIIDGDFEPVDILIGTNSGDGSLLLIQTDKDLFGYFGEKNPQINLTLGTSIIKEQFKKFKSYPDPDAVVEQYLSGLQEDDYEKIRFQVFKALGDYKRICPTVYAAESFAKKSANVYFYVFNHTPSNTPWTPWAPWMLAVHTDEVSFVFGLPLRYPENYTMAEQDLSRRVIDTWTNFAKFGYPVPGTFTKYSQCNPFYTVLDTDSIRIELGPDVENCDFFRSNFGF